MFTLKYLFQNYPDDTLTSNKLNMYESSVSRYTILKRADCFRVATNARVQISIVISDNSSHLTVGNSKVVKINTTTCSFYSKCSKLLLRFEVHYR